MQGLAEVENRLYASLALANALLAARAPRPQGPPACAADPRHPRAALLGLLRAAAGAA